jgi:hypothetical protein
MQTILTWLDRFGLAITIATFAVTVLTVFFGYQAPQFQISDGRMFVAGLVLYQVLMAAAGTAIAGFVYNRFDTVAGGTVAAAFVWSFINVSVMRQIFGPDVWIGDNPYQNPFVTYGALAYIVAFYLIFISKASDEFANRHGMFLFGPTVRSWTRFSTILYLIGASAMFHALWINLDAIDMATVLPHRP